MSGIPDCLPVGAEAWVGSSAGMRQEDIPEHSEEPVIDALEQSGHIVVVVVVVVRHVRQYHEAMAVGFGGKGGDG